jgi:hypothetical protein
VFGQLVFQPVDDPQVFSSSNLHGARRRVFPRLLPFAIQCVPGQGLVPQNALLLTNPINSRLIGNYSALFSQSPIIENSETSHLRGGTRPHFQAAGPVLSRRNQIKNSTA